MTSDRLNRSGESTTTTIADSGTTSAAVDFQAYAFGSFTLPSGYDGTGALTFTTSSTSGGTYTQLMKADGSAAAGPTTTAASKTYPLPTELAGCSWFKFVAGTQTGATVITVMRKR